MKTAQDLIDKAVEEMNYAACRLSEAAALLTEAMLRGEDVTKHGDRYANATGQLRRLREKIEKAAKEASKLPV